MAKPILTMLSDFGLNDPYIAEMKAVILTICPQAKIVDISHSIEKFNIRMGAFVLASASRYFPRGTIHIAVVDPRVGTQRRPLLVKTRNTFYVGPDNGLLMPAAQRQGISQVRTIINPKTMLPKASPTFHGRDVFAPAAAHLANGKQPSDFGPEIGDYVVPTFTKPSLKTNQASGEVLHVDDFGNIITNITHEDLAKAGIKQGTPLLVKMGSKSWRIEFCRAYGEVAAKTLLALIGSHNFLEMAINQGNASKTLNAKPGQLLAILVQT